MAGSAGRRHGCLGYADEDALVEHGLRFLVESAKRGQRLVIVGMLGSWSERLQWALRGRVELREDQLVVAQTGEVYAPGRPIDPQAQLAVYDEMVEQALADGYTGLGVVAEMTALITPELVDAHVAWEATADRYMTEHPLEALCCFPASAASDDVAADIAGAHADADPERPWLPRVFALREGVGVAGELDAFDAPRVRRMLDRFAPQDDELVIDLDGVSFIDHAAVLSLAAFANDRRAAGATVTVEHPPRLMPVIERICGVSI